MADKRLRLLVSERTRLGRETATVERLDKLPREGVETLSDARQRVLTSPVERLNAQGYLTHRDYWAVEMFRECHHRAHVDPGPQSVLWQASHPVNVNSKSVPAVFVAQRIADARIEWRRLEAMFKHGGLVWITLAAAIIDERSIEAIGRDIYACKDRREARAAGRAAIRTAISALADYYGL